MTNLLEAATLVLAGCRDVVAEEHGLRKSHGLRNTVRSLGVVGAKALGASTTLLPLTNSVAVLDSSSERGSLSHSVLSYASFNPSTVAQPVSASMSSVLSSASVILM